MSALFPALLKTAVDVFAVCSMLAVGLRHDPRELIAPLRDLRRVSAGLAANFVLVPLLAIGVSVMLSLPKPLSIGLILGASAAGAPMALRFSQMARGDVKFASSVLIILLMVTLVYMPLVVPVISPEARVSARSIAGPLVLTMFLPLFFGSALRSMSPRVPRYFLPILGPLSTGALVCIVAFTVLAHARSVVSVFGTGAVLAAALMVAGGYGIGHALGVFNGENRRVLGFSTAHRNFAAAMVVAAQNFADTDVLVMLIVYSTLSLLLLIPLARWLQRRPAANVPREQVFRRQRSHSHR